MKPNLAICVQCIKEQLKQKDIALLLAKYNNDHPKTDDIAIVLAFITEHLGFPCPAKNETEIDREKIFVKLNEEIPDNCYFKLELLMLEEKPNEAKH